MQAVLQITTLPAQVPTSGPVRRSLHPVPSMLPMRHESRTGLLCPPADPLASYARKRACSLRWFCARQAMAGKDSHPPCFGYILLAGWSALRTRKFLEIR